MNALLTIVLAVQMLTALGMIGLILLQHGKGADMGAAFGSGASGSLFGASGSANFLSRTTAVLAAVFFACTLALAYFSHLRAARRRRQRARARRRRRRRRPPRRSALPAARSRAARTPVPRRRKAPAHAGPHGSGRAGFGRRADPDAVIASNALLRAQ